MEIRLNRHSLTSHTYTHTHVHACINLLSWGQALLPCNKFCKHECGVSSVALLAQESAHVRLLSQIGYRCATAPIAGRLHNSYYPPTSPATPGRLFLGCIRFWKFALFGPSYLPTFHLVHCPGAPLMQPNEGGSKTHCEWVVCWMEIRLNRHSLTSHTYTHTRTCIHLVFFAYLLSKWERMDLFGCPPHT